LDSSYTENVTLALVRKYAVDGICKSLYFERGLVLMTFFNEVNNTVLCHTNIGSFIDNALKGIQSAVSRRSHKTSDKDKRESHASLYHRPEFMDSENFKDSAISKALLSFV